MVAWIGLGNHAQYAFPEFQVTRSLVIWSILMGPVLGFFAYWFSRLPLPDSLLLRTQKYWEMAQRPSAIR